ncbi:hypothetical protein [Micromonospora parva]|uniref:hypothetical protein n=1 Tax=Micromonospora parva TaxID=1464048 RepID=UPI003409786A
MKAKAKTGQFRSLRYNLYADDVRPLCLTASLGQWDDDRPLLLAVDRVTLATPR